MDNDHSPIFDGLLPAVSMAAAAIWMYVFFLLFFGS